MNLAHSMTSLSHPKIIQGGMGVAVSNWSLARAVSQAGQLGVVSGTALATVLARRLQNGDPGGIMRSAMEAFPIQEWVDRVLKRYFIPEGKSESAPHRTAPMPNLSHRQSAELSVLGCFVEVFLAKRGHDGVVGMNLLEKIQIPTLPSLYGAMLAGVDYILMGAGIPRSIPRILDQFANDEAAEMRIDVQGALKDERFVDRFDPADYGFGKMNLKRPAFIGIISSTVLAKTLAKRAEGSVQGFVVEGFTAGGHNAPPRGAMQLSESGEPVFSERDQPDIEAIRELGLPFWLAGAYGRPGKLAEAQALGAVGIQVGTVFAFCEESGLDPEVKSRTLRQSQAGTIRVFTDPYASPTGFPFKVLEAEGTLSDDAVYQSRKRICDLGYLRTPYRREDGKVGYRCPAELIEDYLRKGGKLEDTVGRKCVCNGLVAGVGMAQTGKGKPEPILLTAGDDARRISDFLKDGEESYTAADVVASLIKG